MLISFSLSNFLSFKDKVTFSLLSNKSRLHPKHLIEKGGLKVLRGTVFYGANASGKTNFFEAVNIFSSMILQGIISPLLSHNQFKLGQHSNESLFEVIFQQNGTIYIYSVTMNPYEVISEKLTKLYKTTDTEELIFWRRGLAVTLGKSLIKKGNQTNWYQSRTFQKNMFFLTKLKFDGIIENQQIIRGSQHIIDANNFFENIEVCKPQSILKPDVFFKLFRLEEYRKYLLNMLKKADVGITDIKWVNLGQNEAAILWQQLFATPFSPINLPLYNFSENNAVLYRSANAFYALYIKDGKKIAQALKPFHGDDIAFDLDSESSGTIRIIDLSLAFYRLQDRGKVTFIDELDCSLHPMLTKFLIQEFFNANTESQLIISLHDVNLLTNDIWRPDEVWFIEKQANGASDMYSLSQFRPRFDKKISNDYCAGKYGAVPMLGKLRI